jgi:LysM repeat protein
MDPRTLMRLNGKKPGDKIVPGERLIVSGNAAANASSTKNARASASASTNKRITHRVRSGETLSSIAKRYGVSIAQLVRWNDISANRVLRIGQRLIIRTQE